MDKSAKPQQPSRNDLRSFTVAEARPLPVILLADVSGSMDLDSKIGALNRAVREMVEAFSGADELRAEIQVAVITFGGEACLHVPLQPASTVQWRDMEANGTTPLGAALDLAVALLEDKAAIPGRAYRPVVVLVSDGQPMDEWEAPLVRLTTQGRASKADRLALAIGADADVEMLARFLGSPKKKVFQAEDASRIKEFFQLVTMSVTTRSRSANPNDVPPMKDHLDDNY